MKKLFFVIFNFFENLSAPPRAGGLHISDSFIQYISFSGENPHENVRSLSLRLPPKSVEKGRVENSENVLRALREMREMIGGTEKENVPVIVTVPSGNVFTQSFTIPNVPEGKRNEAIALNLQMLSPISAGGAYMSAHIIAEKIESLELFGAFVEKKTVDQLSDLLRSTGFNPLAYEFTSISLTRLMEHEGTLQEGLTLVVHISADGVNLFLVRRGMTSFDYFRSWKSIQGEGREIPKALFESILTQEIQKVLNFSLGRFKEPIERVLVSAEGVREDVQKIIKERFGLPVEPLICTAAPLTEAWYATLGAAIRGAMDQRDDKWLSLAPLGVRTLFREEQTLRFASLWRNIFVGVSGFLLLLFAGTAYFMVNQSLSLSGRLKEFVGTPTKEVMRYERSAQDFNALVGLIGEVKSTSAAWYPLLGQIRSLAEKNNIVLDRVSINSISDPITITARTVDADYYRIIRFKDSLATQENVTEVELPPSQIITLEGGQVRFTLSFSLSSGEAVE